MSTLITHDEAHSRKHPSRPLEPKFDFYSTIAIEPFITHRAIINDWAKDLSDAQKDRLRRQMARSESGWQSGFLELCSLALFRRSYRYLGYELTDERSGLSPDLTFSKASSEFYVEATAIVGDSRIAKRNNLITRLHALIEELDLPPKVKVGIGRCSMRSDDFPKRVVAKKIRQAIDEHIETLMQNLYSPIDVLVKLHDGDMHFSLMATGVDYSTNVWAVGGGAFFASPRGEIAAKKLNAKASKYKPLQSGLVLSITSSSIQTMSSTIEDVQFAVYGQTVSRQYERYMNERSFKPLWRDGRNSHCSAVLAINSPNIIHFRNPNLQPALLLNCERENDPFPELAIRKVYRDGNGLVENVATDSAAEMFGLSGDWHIEADWDN